MRRKLGIFSAIWRPALRYPVATKTRSGTSEYLGAGHTTKTSSNLYIVLRRRTRGARYEFPFGRPVYHGGAGGGGVFGRSFPPPTFFGSGTFMVALLLTLSVLAVESQPPAKAARSNPTNTVRVKICMFDPEKDDKTHRVMAERQAKERPRAGRSGSGEQR